jgi:hypothetical protein
LVVGAPDQLHHIAEHQHQAVGQQELIQRIGLVDRPQEDDLGGDTHDHHGERRDQQGGPEAAELEADPGEDEERAVHVERAVREIEDSEHAEDERKPRRHQIDAGSDEQAVDELHK